MATTTQQTLIDNIPQQLRNLNQWVNWWPVQRNGKTTKPPINPHTGRYAEVDDPSTWGSFSLCSSKSANKGLVLTESDPYVGADFDDCIDENDNIDPVILGWVKKLNSYTELSPSGRGLRVFGRASLKKNYGAKPYEIYHTEHYLTVTGNHLPGTPTTINDIQRPLDKLTDWLDQQSRGEKKRTQERGASTSLTLSDTEIIGRALAGNDPTFGELFDGSHPLATDDPSRADYWLALRIAFYSDDPSQISRIMRASKLNRDKYDRALGKSTYLDYTIGKVLSSNPNRYEGNRSEKKKESISGTVTQTGDLVDNFFDNPDPAPVMVAPVRLPLMRILEDDSEPGRGDWPEAPKKKRNRPATTGTILTIRPTRDGFTGKLTDSHDRNWEQCAREFYFRVKRETCKALAHLANEQMYYQAGLDLVDMGRTIERQRKAAQRKNEEYIYQVYPYEMGQYCIVSNHPGDNDELITEDRRAAYALFQQWLDTPEGETLKRHSQGYGLRFEGVAGDGRLKFVTRQLENEGQHAAAAQLKEEIKQARHKLQLITKMKRAEMENELVATGYRVLKSRFEFYDLGKFANDVKNIADDLQVRGGGSVWFELENLKMSRLEDTEKNNKSVCVSRDNDGFSSVFSPPSIVDSIPFTPSEVVQYAAI